MPAWSAAHARRRQQPRWQVVRSAHPARREFGTGKVDDSITSFAAEATWQAKRGMHEWTLGAALLYDELSVPDVAGVGYRYTVPGLFAQDEFSPASWLSVSASGRVDFHDEFGTFVSPRLSALSASIPTSPCAPHSVPAIRRSHRWWTRSRT